MREGHQPDLCLSHQLGEQLSYVTQPRPWHFPLQCRQCVERQGFGAVWQLEPVYRLLHVQRATPDVAWQVPWLPQPTVVHGSQTVGTFPPQLPSSRQVNVASPPVGATPVSSQV